MADLEDFKGDLDDPEAVEAALAEQLKILQQMQAQQAKIEGQVKKGHHDFNKLQNISNFKDIAKQVVRESAEGGYMDEQFEDEYL